MNINKLREIKAAFFNDENLKSEPVLYYRFHMFKRVILLTCSFVTILSVYFILTNQFQAASILLVNLLAYGASYYVAKNKNVAAGTSMFLISVTITTCLFMWIQEGLFDEATIAFPGFLILSFMIANFTLARWLLLMVSLNILAIGLVNEFGIYTHPTNKSDLDSAIVIIILLVMVTFCLHLANLSSYKLMKTLEAENKKVKRSKKEIIRLQNHDSLTGLPNRFLAEQMVNERLQIGTREGFETSLLFIDLDNFKQINDTFGHGAGDTVLKTVAQRLVSAVRASDKVCRFGGDEFVIVAIHERESLHPGVSPLADKLLQVLGEPVILVGNHISLTVSIGISVAPPDGANFEDLYKKADLAMYATKQAGRNSYQYFNNNMHSDSSRKLAIAQGLRSALSNNELSVVYQSIQGLTNNNITGAEALMRWQHPTLGPVSPNEFIPIAEQSGSIEQIGYWVLNEAVAACKGWHNNGFNNLRVCVNVSAMQFHRSQFEKSVKEVLDKHQLAGKYLVIELTESLLFDIQNKLHNAIEAIRSFGVSVAIDDFGTGYSNLGYLHKNDINILKIDRSFISNILASSQDKAIAATIINMSATLGMDVVAEGIESNEVKQQLITMGCTFGQGYLWSKPIPNNDFINLVAKQHASIASQ